MRDLNQTEMHIKSRQPVPEQYKSDMVQNDKLQMGPERTLHSVENVWSNFTEKAYKIPKENSNRRYNV